MRPLMQVKLITIISVMFFAAYPVAELTRCIVQYNILPLLRAQRDGAAFIWVSPFNDIPTLDTFYLELTIIWTLYLIIPIVLNIVFNLIYAMGKKYH